MHLLLMGLCRTPVLFQLEKIYQKVLSLFLSKRIRRLRKKVLNLFYFVFCIDKRKQIRFNLVYDFAFSMKLLRGIENSIFFYEKLIIFFSLSSYILFGCLYKVQTSLNPICYDVMEFFLKFFLR